jgi:hypothetical protein
MSCPEYTDAILDVARGADVGPERLRQVRAHVAECAACRVRLSREESLTAGLGALSRTVAHSRPSAQLESRLLDAFRRAASAKATAGQAGIDPRSVVGEQTRTRWRWVSLAAAAAIMLAVIPAWLLEPPPKPKPKPQPPAPQVVASRPAAAVQTPPVAPAVSTPARVGSARPRRKAEPTGILRPTGFVALPGAVGLPQFESGVIARIEISVTSLPNYGIQIAPDAARATVPADILVGQDGLARAIRLVKTSTASTATRSAQ